MSATQGLTVVALVGGMFGGSQVQGGAEGAAHMFFCTFCFFRRVGPFGKTLRKKRWPMVLQIFLLTPSWGESGFGMGGPRCLLVCWAAQHREAVTMAG